MGLLAKTTSCCSRLSWQRSTLAANLQTRHFNYNHWYKIEKERDSRVRKKAEESLRDKSLFDIAKMVGSQAHKEYKKWRHEMRTQWEESNKPELLQHGAFDTLFKFNSADDLAAWKVSTDAGYKVGRSSASLQLTQHNTAVFSGFLSLQFDKPERTRAIYTGFANMTSITRLRSFYREDKFDLRRYTHFLVRVRGDGRAYMMVLSTPEHFTLTHTWQHSCPLYTRGGPYWQWAKIPFSKFVNVTHSRISDKQYPLIANRVRNIGFTCMDGIEGPFRLEIDFVGVVRDNETTEKFAYEMYKVPKFVANS